jgi:transposase InsO family protein
MRSSQKRLSFLADDKPHPKGSLRCRSSRRCRVAPEGVLSRARGQLPRLLRLPKPATLSGADASTLAYRVDPRGSFAFRGTYGSRLVHAELTLEMGVQISERLVAGLMGLARIYELPGPARVKRLRGIVTADDLVNRKFHRLSPNELWVSDITEHPTREGKVFCCCVLDSFSRRIMGWSVDTVQDANLVVNRVC